MIMSRLFVLCFSKGTFFYKIVWIMSSIRLDIYKKDLKLFFTESVNNVFKPLGKALKREKKNRFLSLGVTGGPASGKSTVCRMLENRGGKYINTDVLAREVVAKGTAGHKKIVDYFGENTLDPHGEIDRPALRKTIINDPVSKKKLESIVHPEVLLLMNRLVEEARQNGYPFAAVEVPLLFEIGIGDQFDYTVAVLADEAKQLGRISIRDKVSKKDARSLMHSQLSSEEKAKNADFILNNNGNHEDLEKQVEKMLMGLF
jgi:dephospho-CoA kinase